MGWINFVETEVENKQGYSNGFMLPLKSILLDKHERLNYYKEIGKIKEEQQPAFSLRNYKPKEIDINKIDHLGNINDFDDPLLIKERNCNNILII